ncbi:TPA: Rpn family recombination-promoting nuclease/putative transposase [Providencia rettgeri]|uniref:Rpn family recombination-promoting nuclease/putative transposase n=1 Tax=Providencia TaxID=586 RepID=UPI001EE773D2|nr:MULTISPECIES: Rpn family recombination-promoting nuclease/putative transposase [Providencia]MCG5370324.1 Rpn family recombination-promoting nuclease/putative transposase [Providencia rettgeri]MCX9124780.1 Rpn family recombination-promoting nuclease/putative transposase [Providencia rettgeri]MCX9128891.1 Rpn family recombination-promoting nuclease/putative transposase [Providencia rettgeri]HEM8339590.1 Rpn family recombination-promoting nuclease/putative transposase [Providencia rettgeri]HEM
MKKKTTSTIHDAAFKGFMTNIANARDFFEIHLPEHIKSLCDFNTLSLTNSSFIDKQLRSRLSDVLYSVRTSQGEGYIYLLVEHQSTPDKLMAWRLMHYAFLAMNQHMQQGNTTLPIVVPILFYHGGRSPYPYTQLWTECFPLPEIAHELYTQPFPLVDITVIDDNELVNHRKIAVMELAMKHKYLRDEFQQVLPLLAKALNKHYNSDNDIITILNYLFIALDSHNFEQVIQVLGEQTEKHKETIMNIAQRLQDKGRQEGRQEGLQEGFKKGKEEANIATARNLLEQGVSIEIIMKSTGLSREKLISLQ